MRPINHPELHLLILGLAALMAFVCNNPCTRKFDNSRSLSLHQITCETRLQDNPLLENAAEKYEAKKAERRANKRRRLLDGSGVDAIPAETIVDSENSDIEHNSFDVLVSLLLYVFYHHILMAQSPLFLIQVGMNMQELHRQAAKLLQEVPSRNLLLLFQILYL
jgi:hypothetical protein